MRDLGFDQTDDRGWITNWTNSGRKPGEVSLAYVRRLDETTGALVMLPTYPGVVPGVYPGVPGSLSLDRFGTLEGVRFRVSSPEEEWRTRTGSRPSGRQRVTVASCGRTSRYWRP